MDRRKRWGKGGGGGGGVGENGSLYKMSGHPEMQFDVYAADPVIIVVT